MPTEGLQARHWRTIGASVRGSLHVRDGRPNQDAICFLAETGATQQPASVIVAVADGHGGSRHFRSQTGSRLAVEQARTVLAELAPLLLAAPVAERSALALSTAPRRIVEGWVTAVHSHLAAHPIEDGEWRGLIAAEGEDAAASVTADPLLAYGATLLAALAFRDGLLLLQLGDGDILAVADDGTVSRPLPADERLVGNLTTSLCQPGAVANFRCLLLAQAPALLLLSTDGYANSYRSDADFLQVGRDYLDMLQAQGWEAVAKQLPEFLDHASKNGSGDDISLGLLLADRGKDSPAPTTTGGDELARLQTQLAIIEQRHARTKKWVAAGVVVVLLAFGWMKREMLTALFAAEPSQLHGVGTKPIEPSSSSHPIGKASPELHAVPHSLSGFTAQASAKSIVFTATLSPVIGVGEACEAQAMLWGPKSDPMKITVLKLTGSKATASNAISVSMPWVPDDKIDKTAHDPASRASMRLLCEGHTTDETGREKIAL